MKTEIIEIIEAAQNSAAKGDFKSVLYDIEYIKQQYNVNWGFVLAIEKVEYIARQNQNNIVIRDSLHFALRDAKQELFPARR